MRTITFGVNNSFAAKRWPEPEAWIDVVQHAGLSSVQFSFDVLGPEHTDDLSLFRDIRDACERKGILLLSTFTGLGVYGQSLLGHPAEAVRRRAEEWYRNAILATAALGCRVTGGHIGALSARQFADRQARRAAINGILEAVLRLADFASLQGLTCLLWEIMAVEREYPTHLDEVQQLMDELSRRASLPIRLCLDVGHACTLSAAERERNPYEWVVQAGSWTHTIHLQQTDGAYDRHWPFTARYNPMGIIDPTRVIALVSSLPQESVHLILEPLFAPEVGDEQVIQDVTESAAFWQTALDQFTPKTVS